MPCGAKKRKAAKKKKELQENSKNIAPEPDVQEESSNFEVQEAGGVEKVHENTMDSVISGGSLMDSKMSEDEDVHCTESTDSKNSEEVPFQRPVQEHDDNGCLESDDGVVTDTVPVDYVTEPQQASEIGLQANAEIGIPAVADASLVAQSQEDEEENRVDEVHFSELLNRVKMSTIEQLEAMEKGRALLQKILDDLNSIQLMVESRI